MLDLTQRRRDDRLGRTTGPKGTIHETHEDPERHLMFWTLALIASLWALCELGAMWAGRR